MKVRLQSAACILSVPYMSLLFNGSKTSSSNNYSDYTIGPYEDLDKNLLENGSKFTVTPVVIAGHPAIKNEFTAFRIQQIPCPPPFPGPVSTTNIYIPIGDKVYTIEYRNGTDSPAIAETIRHMIQSLEI